MELGTIEEVELIVSQIASNKIPPPNKAQSLVIIRQLVTMAKQIEKLRAELNHEQRLTFSLQDELERIKAEPAEAKKDAERYRWLRDVGDAVWKPLGKRYMDSCALPSDVDSAIDAAMRTIEESSVDGKEQQ